MCCKRRPCSFPVAWDNIDYPIGNSRLLKELAEQQAREWRLFRGLENHRAPGGQRRAEFPRRHQQREVPGNDLSYDTDWLTQRVREILGARRVRYGDRNRVPLEFGRPPCHVAEQVGSQRNVGGARYFEGLAVIECFEFGELLQVLINQVCKFPHDAAAFGRCEPRPGTRFKGCTRSLHRPVNILTIAFRDASQHFPRGGVVGWEGFSGSRLDPFAIDEHLSRFGNKVRYFI